MSYFKTAKACLTVIAAASLLVACGGGSGDGQSSGAKTEASFAGSAQAGVNVTEVSASGTITVTDPDAGEAGFTLPSSTSLRGLYGTWTFSSVGPVGSWSYKLTTPPATRTTETLTVSSLDGTTKDIVVTISVIGAATNITPNFQGASASDKLAVFTRLNHYRTTCGFGALLQNTTLERASQAHADYQAINDVQGHNENPSLPGFTGADPGQRMAAFGYEWKGAAAENIGYGQWGAWFSSGSSDFPATEPSATHALDRLVATVYHLGGLMHDATEVGIGVSSMAHSETSFLKILNIKQAVGMGTEAPPFPANEIRTFPCEGIEGLSPTFRGETPDPFPDFNNDSRESSPYGQPIYITTGAGSNLTLVSHSVRLKGGNVVPTRLMTSANDPHARLQPNQLFLTPTQRLADNATYVVTLSGTNTGGISPDNPSGAWERTFEFQTGTTAGN